MISIVGGFVVGFVAAMLSTPLLWKLEPVLGMELAGHSGPSDRVIYVFIALFVVLIEALLLFSSRWNRRPVTKK
jgi:hypothetical protein